MINPLSKYIYYTFTSTSSRRDELEENLDLASEEDSINFI